MGSLCCVSLSTYVEDHPHWACPQVADKGTTCRYGYHLRIRLRPNKRSWTKWQWSYQGREGCLTSQSQRTLCLKTWPSIGKSGLSQNPRQPVGETVNQRETLIFKLGRWSSLVMTLQSSKGRNPNGKTQALQVGV